MKNFFKREITRTNDSISVIDVRVAQVARTTRTIHKEHVRVTISNMPIKRTHKTYFPILSTLIIIQIN